MTGNNGMMPDFKDLKYVRPDVTELLSFMKDIRLKIMTSTDIDSCMNAMVSFEKRISNFQTSYSLCNILHDLDTSDDFYKEEVDFFDDAFAEVSELASSVLTSFSNCPCADDIKERYGEMIFLKARNMRETISGEVIEELGEESSLENDYVQYESEAKIPFDDKELNISMLSPYLESLDSDIRIKAHKALDDYYMSRKDSYDKIFDSLVSIRTTIARKLGFNTFTELGYKRMERYDYGRAEVERFREAICSYIVPITVQIRKNQAQRLGLENLDFSDLPCLFKMGNPVPNVPLAGYDRVVGNFFEKIFGKDPSFYDVLSEHGFTDLISRKNKSTGGYCITLDDYAIPFIFMNGNGTADDVATIVHEGGHAYAAIQSAEVSPFLELLSPTLECCEIHSTAMEFLSYPHMNMFYGDRAEQYTELHMTLAMLFLPYGCMVDEFQHIVYDNPELMPEERHQSWKKLEEKYQPFINYGEDYEFHRMGGAWQKKNHIFTTPFYYIDYCIAHIAALELWDESRDNMESALSKYNTLCGLGGTDTFLNLLKKAGLSSPFSEDLIKKIAFDACKFLEL